ncbi:MAG: isoprenylcysteine carboxylmethyltransferase family protein [Planctomycetota bacterium]
MNKKWRSYKSRYMIMVKIGNILFHIRNYVFPFSALLLFITGPEIHPDWFLVMLVGLFVVILGETVRIGTIGLTYIIRGGKNRKIYAKGLVAEGVFKHVRNPMYIGNELILIGMAIATNNLVLVAIAVPLGAFIYLAITLAEEDFLRKQFGPEYDEYCKATPRFLPNFSGIIDTYRNSVFHWKRVLVKEFNTIYAWNLAWSSLLLYHLWMCSGPSNIELYKLDTEVFIAVITIVYLIMIIIKKRKLIVAD